MNFIGEGSVRFCHFSKGRIPQLDLQLIKGILCRPKILIYINLKNLSGIISLRQMLSFNSLFRWFVSPTEWQSQAGLWAVSRVKQKGEWQCTIQKSITFNLLFRIILFMNVCICVGMGGYSMLLSYPSISVLIYTGLVGLWSVQDQSQATVMIYWGQSTSSTWHLRILTVRIISLRSSLLMVWGKKMTKKIK